MRRMLLRCGLFNYLKVNSGNTCAPSNSRKFGFNTRKTALSPFAGGQQIAMPRNDIVLQWQRETHNRIITRDSLSCNFCCRKQS